MPPYRSKSIGEIAIPASWPNPEAGEGGETFTTGRGERFNWSRTNVNEPATPETFERDFRRMAQTNPAYSDLSFSRFDLLGRAHVMVRHRMWERLWAKTYLIAFGREKHFVDACCPGPAEFTRLEPVWDSVVASYRPIPLYAEAYDAECRVSPGEPGALRLVSAEVLDSPHLATLGLVYVWDAALPAEDASRLAARAIAYIACAIHEAANQTRLGSMLSPVPYGRRPAWLVDGARAPISVSLTQVELESRGCQMTVGPIAWASGKPKPIDPALLERLSAGFQQQFGEIRV